MDVKTFHRHSMAMNQLEAQELLTRLKTVEYPSMNDDARSKFHREISKRAFPVQKVHSFDDIEKALGLK